jgi:hypothetical protein
MTRKILLVAAAIAACTLGACEDTSSTGSGTDSGTNNSGTTGNSGTTSGG